MYTPHRVNVMIKASPYIQRQCVLGMNTCTFEQNRGSMPTIKGLNLISEYDQYNHKPQITPWHRKEEPLKPWSHEIMRFVMNLRDVRLVKTTKDQSSGLSTTSRNGYF